MKGSRRIVRRLGLALAVAAVFAPAAQGMPADPDVSGAIPSSQRIYADDLHSISPVPNLLDSNPRRYADDLHSQTPVSNAQVSNTRQYADDRHEPVSSIPRGYAPVNTRVDPSLYQPAGSLVLADSKGFDWSDAGVGAGGALGLMLLLGGGALLAARHGRRGRLAAS